MTSSRDLAKVAILPSTTDGKIYVLTNGAWVAYTPATAGQLTKSYQSANQTITVGGSLTLAHGLGAIPKLVQATLVCLTANNGITVGQEIDIEALQFAIVSGSSRAQGAMLVADATNIRVQFGNATTSTFYLYTAAGANFAITNTNFALIVRAYL